MSKIRFIFAIILSLSIISNCLLAEEIRSIPSELIRKKRHAQTFNVEDFFREKNTAYIQLIECLRESFSSGSSVPVKQTGISIPVVGSSNPYTLVRLRSDHNNLRYVDLVFDNASTYLIGFVVYDDNQGGRSRFYRGGAFSHITIPNMTPYDVLPREMSYPELRIGENSEISFSDPNDLITPLIHYHTTTINKNVPPQAPEDVRRALGRLVIMTSEAARFHPVQCLVQDALNSYRPFNMGSNFFAAGGMTYPDRILLSNTHYTIRWLTTNWRTFSSLIDTVNTYASAQINHAGEAIGLSRRDLLSILALAHSCVNSHLPGPSRRFTRDTESLSLDKCYLGNIEREGIMTGNSYWGSDSAAILISEILDTHIDYGASAHAG